MSQDEIKKLKATIYKKVDQLNDETFLQMVERLRLILQSKRHTG
jgi:hypothetical protein